RERHLRLDRNPVLPAAQEDLPRRLVGPTGKRSRRAAPASGGRVVTLQPGFPIQVYPTFHLQLDLRERVLLGDRDGHAWQPPDDDELRCLLPDAATPATPARLLESVCLFQLPRHLRAAWWDLLDRAAGVSLSRLDGFDRFAAEIARFLEFKDMPP